MTVEPDFVAHSPGEEAVKRGVMVVVSSVGSAIAHVLRHQQMSEGTSWSE